MLVNLCDYKQSVTLIANSGVQFLDFGLTPQESAHHGPLCAQNGKRSATGLDFDLASGRYTFARQHWRATRSGEAGKYPDAALFAGCPRRRLAATAVLRFNPPRTFVEGPDNWARVQVRKLPQPDSAGNTHRLP